MQLCKIIKTQTDDLQLYRLKPILSLSVCHTAVNPALTWRAEGGYKTWLHRNRSRYLPDTLTVLNCVTVLGQWSLAKADLETVTQCSRPQDPMTEQTAGGSSHLCFLFAFPVRTPQISHVLPQALLKHQRLTHTHTHNVPCTGTSQAGKQSAYEISPWEYLTVKKPIHTHTYITHSHTHTHTHARTYATATQSLPGVSFHFLSHDQSNLAFI